MVLAKCSRPKRLTSTTLASTLAGVAAAYLGSLVAAGIALADAPVPPEGIWYTKDQESIIKVHPCTDDATAYCGTMVWLKEPNEADGTPKADKLNKDPAKKGKPMIGLDILLDMKADDDHWTGKAYNPEDGKFYSITFHVKTATVENDSADLRGCVLGFLCQTETFTRAASVPGGDPTANEPTGGKKAHKKAKKESSAQREGAE